MNHKIYAGWAALIIALVLSIIATIARFMPATTTSINEAVIITSLLAFAGSAFGISAYEAVRGKPGA